MTMIGKQNFREPKQKGNGVSVLAGFPFLEVICAFA